MRNNNIKSRKHLLAVADDRSVAGNTDLSHFVYNHSIKSINDLISTTWEMAAASDDVKRQKKSRMEVLQEASGFNCVPGCNGAWFNCAIEVLTQNCVNPVLFAASMRDLLQKGRGKHRNIMVIGPKDSAKTFLFTPLQVLFKVFSNPSNDKYAWIGADEAEVIFLNDFRWSNEKIDWDSFLHLLEGQPCHLPAPKNHFANDICIVRDTPIFATSKERVRFRQTYNRTCEKEDAMMDARWKVYEFFVSIPEEEQIPLKSCPKCFADMVLMEEL